MSHGEKFLENISKHGNYTAYQRGPVHKISKLAIKGI